MECSSSLNGKFYPSPKENILYILVCECTYSLLLCAREPVGAISLGARNLELRFENKRACQEMMKRSIAQFSHKDTSI